MSSSFNFNPIDNKYYQHQQLFPTFPMNKSTIDMVSPSSMNELSSNNSRRNSHMMLSHEINFNNSSVGVPMMNSYQTNNFINPYNNNEPQRHNRLYSSPSSFTPLFQYNNGKGNI